MSILEFINKQPRFSVIACVFIIGLIITRIVILPSSPPGFYIDEAATGAHVVHMVEEGTNAHHQAWPLFSSSLGGGYTTPIYLYPLTVWSSVFGTHEISLRYFSEFITLISIAFLALAVKYWLGGKMALVGAIVGLALPWGWLQGSLAWDPTMVPLFVAISFFAFSALLFSASRKLKIISMILLPVALIALAYVYPPARVTAPLLYAMFYIILYLRQAISLRVILLSAFGAFLLVLPLALFMFQPEALGRTSSLSVFSHNSILQALTSLALNLLLLLNPVFLFFVGDPNLRHSTMFQGMLGIGALIPVLVLILHAIKHRGVRLSPLTNKLHLFLFITILGTIFGLLGSALTAEGQPHSLRATATWPFMVLLITLGWYIIFEAKRRALTTSAILVFTVATLFYAVDLLAFYPTRAATSFDSHIRTKLKNGESADYPPMVLDYYENKSQN